MLREGPPVGQGRRRTRDANKEVPGDNRQRPRGVTMGPTVANSGTGLKRSARHYLLGAARGFETGGCRNALNPVACDNGPV